MLPLPHPLWHTQHDVSMLIFNSNYGTSPQFVGQPMYFQSSYPRDTSFFESAMVGNHGSLPQKIDQPIYFSPLEACELVGNNGSSHWMNSPFSPAELSGYRNDNTSNPSLQLDFYNNHPPSLLQTNDTIRNKHLKLSDDHTSS